MTDAPEAPAAPGAAERLGGRAGPGLKTAYASVALLGLALLVTAAGPGLYRLNALDYGTATSGAAKAVLGLACLGALVALVAIVVSIVSKASRGVLLGIVAATACLIIGGRAFSFVAGDAFPPIWDVQTDWTQPVAFSEAVIAARAAEKATPVRDDATTANGKTFAAAQAEVYDVKPLLVAVSPQVAAAQVAVAMQRAGWDVVTDDLPGGRIEAVHRSFWYGLASDVAVRVQPQGTGSRIDVRSTSREAAPDKGANARRVETLLDDVAFALRGEGEESRVGETPAP